MRTHNDDAVHGKQLRKKTYLLIRKWSDGDNILFIHDASNSFDCLVYFSLSPLTRVRSLHSCSLVHFTPFTLMKSCAQMRHAWWLKLKSHNCEGKKRGNDGPFSFYFTKMCAPMNTERNMASHRPCRMSLSNALLRGNCLRMELIDTSKGCDASEKRCPRSVQRCVWRWLRAHRVNSFSEKTNKLTLPSRPEHFTALHRWRL